MVTSYYIMKLSKSHKNLDLSDHFSNKSISKRIKLSSCRVCLDNGFISLFKLDSKMLDTLKNVCSLQICKNDKFATKLCNICYKFLKNAALFIERAKESAQFLNKFKNKNFKNVETKDTHNETSEISDPENFSKNSKSLKTELKFIDKKSVKEEIISATKSKQKVKKTTLSKKVQCKICKSVVTKSYFKQHMTMHDPNHSKYVCEVCGKSYRLICAFYNHRFQHSTDFQHKCQWCPYKARDKALLRNHIKVHIGDYKYMCTKCPSRFLFRSNLNRHMWKHKEKQFSCDKCNRMFHTKLAVRQHHDVDHLGMKNHLCNICGKAFGYRKAMMKHQRTVHKRQKKEYSRMPTYLQYENKSNVVEQST